MDKVDTNQQVEWNMAQLLNMELARLRTDANDQFVLGNYSKAVELIRSMKATAVHVLSPEERKRLKKVEAKIDFVFEQITRNEFLSGFERLGGFGNSALRKLYLEYSELVQDLLEQYGFLGDRKKDSSKITM